MEDVLQMYKLREGCPVMVKNPTSSQATRIESETAFFPCESMKDGAILITGTLFNFIGGTILDGNSGFKSEFE